MDRRSARLASALAAALAVAVALIVAGTGGHRKPAKPPARPSRAEAERSLGELVVARYSGTKPSRRLLGRVRAGQVGGVVLFSENTAAGLAATREAIAELQREARVAGDYPLLVMTDQEGGEVKRIASIPPTVAPAETGSDAAARREGASTGEALRSIGFNVDLAPVADVEHDPDSFLGTRAYGSDPALVAERACAFAEGLAQAGLAYTLKHFPGLGDAAESTDEQPVSIAVTGASLRRDYAAYRRCGHGPRALAMISSAGYPALTGSSTPAVASPEIYRRELPDAGVNAVTISDDLDSPAIVRLRGAARQALDAGLDLLLYAQSEASSAGAYKALRGEVRTGTLDARTVMRAVGAVQRLKTTLAGTHS